MKKELLDKLEKLNSKLSPEIRDDFLIIKHPEYNFDKAFPSANRSVEDVINDIEQYLKIKYIKGKCLYKENYIEFLISLSDSDFADTLGRCKFHVETDSKQENKIHYEIGEISDLFFEFVDNTLEFDYSKPDLTSLKIFKINKILHTSIDEHIFLTKAEHIAKSIIFDISHKVSVFLKLIDMSTIKKDEKEPLADLSEKAKLIVKKSVSLRYDTDLVQYYYRAVQMVPSEFQYLAFYQVLECIFDEVFLSETIQDSRKIIESSWFSTDDDKNIEQLIDIIERYNKAKNDREKIKLVLEKYFKGNARDEAYFLSNKNIIDILNNLKKIKDKNELKDLNKISSIIYDFRSKCTHSNRAYPFRTEFQDSQEELLLYIDLIKNVAEKIILNYHT